MSIPLLVLSAVASEEQSQVVQDDDVECSLQSGQQQSDSGIQFCKMYSFHLFYSVSFTFFCCFLICIWLLKILPLYVKYFAFIIPIKPLLVTFKTTIKLLKKLIWIQISQRFHGMSCSRTYTHTVEHFTVWTPALTYS